MNQAPIHTILVNTLHKKVVRGGSRAGALPHPVSYVIVVHLEKYGIHS